ncbi:uncharacterized protein LOC122077857 [Macadamia integrifolia]|uniref:uncharacterized protein LOC122077857 n=1 Tax=Macadamia integrifolia TaxID=60698 RepID=UPI001C4F4957|nr:uncharacterized protein LOC122077857 [Macadamia integrifolia]
MPPKYIATDTQRQRYNGNKRTIRETLHTNKRNKNQAWLLKAQLAESSSTSSNSENFENQPSGLKVHVLKKVPPCTHCGAKKFEYEPPSFCCCNGNVVLASTTVPDELYTLFTSQTSEAIEFRRYIRAYNSIFSFTSLGVHVDKDLANGKDGIYTFRAQGQLYHDLPPILPEKDNPCYLQLYFYDTDNELQNRMKVLQDSKLKEPIVSKLMDILSINPYARFFKSLKDVHLLENNEIIITSDVHLDQRVYNLPSVDQVAAIWVEGNNPHRTENCDIVIEGHSGKKHRVVHYYGCYDALQYPLLYPNGEVGWHRSIKQKNVTGRVLHDLTSEESIFNREGDFEGFDESNKNRVSPRAYYCQKLQIRDGHRSILLYAGRLLHQYVVDMYIKIEAT